MKKLIMMSIFGALLSANANASETKILSLQQTEKNSILLTIETNLYCNDPVVSLEYSHAGRSKEGPYFFDLKVIGQNRMACLGSDVLSVELPLPSILRAGDIFKVVLDSGKPFSIKVQ